METTAHTAIGMTDGMRAARAETRRIIEESNGDFVAEQKEVLQRLHEASLITAEEVEILVQLYRHVIEASHDKGDVTRSYFDARTVHDRLAANIAVWPVASFQSAARTRGRGIIAFTKTSRVTGRRIAAGATVKPPSESAPSTRSDASLAASTTASMYSVRPLPGPTGRSGATASIPRRRNSPTMADQA